MGVYAVTSEMSDNSKSNVMEDTMDKAEVLKTVSAQDIQEHVPKAVIAEITEKAVEDSKATVISEMEEKNGKVIAEMRAENRELQLNQTLQSKVVDKNARKMIRRMVIGEMQDEEPVDTAVDRVLGSEEGKAIVSEMTIVEPLVQPKVEQKAAKASKTSRFIRRKG